MSDKNEMNKIKTEQENELISRQQVRSSDDDHQLEFIDEVNGIAFINDSKSIRLTATRNSLGAIKTSVVLIIGGDDRDNDYSMIRQQVKEKVVAIIYLGNYSDKILKHYSSHYILFAKAGSIKEAVELSSAYAKAGEVVLFSPACPSYHAFDNYKNRGIEFREIIKSLKK
jgi:UDP-N-acetylmuramoylalanine--D-glutamate ligase